MAGSKSLYFDRSHVDIVLLSLNFKEFLDIPISELDEIVRPNLLS